MTSLTAPCTTTDLQHVPHDRRPAGPVAASGTAKPLPFSSRGVKLLCAVASVVVSMSLFGSVAVGITMPTTAAAIGAGPESA
jgi:hypothetical protein